MTEILHLAERAPLPPDALRKAAEGARSCKVVAFPTDTVYGIGSTGLIKAASRRIYQIKDRPNHKPLPIMVWSVAEAQRWVEWTPAAEALAKRFWPGALTLVLKPTEQGRILTFAEYSTIAIRIPNHPVALRLLEQSGVPWAVTSANKSGEIPLSDGAAVAKEFNGLVDFIIDGGKVAGVESTLADASQPQVRILREGSLSRAAVLEVVGQTA